MMAKKDLVIGSEQTEDEVSDEYTEESEGETSRETATSEAAGGRLLASMVADPEIQAILAARRENREVKVVDAQATDNGEVEAEEARVSELDKELENLDEDTRQIVRVLDKHLTSRLAPVTEELGILKKIAEGYERKAVTDKITEVADKHPDFHKYRSKMAEISRAEGAGLAVEELYLLAKFRSGDVDLSPASTDSERPTPTPRRGPGAKDRSAGKLDGAGSSRKEFQITLADALDKLETRPRM